MDIMKWRDWTRVLCACVCVCHKENIWWRERRGKRPSDRLHRHAQPVHCCHSLHLLTFSIMSFTHGCFFLPFYTSLIPLLCLPPFSPPSLFCLLSKWPFSRSLCGDFFIYIYSCGVSQRTYPITGVSGGCTKEGQKRCSQICQGLGFNLCGGTHRESRTKTPALGFLTATSLFAQDLVDSNGEQIYL